MEVYLISKKRGSKQNLIRSGSFSSGKIVFALLTEVITLYMGPIIIDIRQSSLETLISYFFFWILSLGNRLNDLFQVFFDISSNVSRSLLV